jgi:hypothetical protein
MIRISSAFIAILLSLTACSHRVPVATVEIIDTSLSITPRAEHAALDAVERQIAGMQRGDILVLIPITGDAANDAGGRVLRLSSPTVRETYDADLRRFQTTAQKRFDAWVRSLDPHQSRTDILGTLDAARQEISGLPMDSERRLIVVSDFLEDESAYRFVSTVSLADPAHARELAERVRTGHAFRLQGIPVCLGRLESSDFEPLQPHRKDAVQAFWTAYFTGAGQMPEIHFDGTGVLAGAGSGCSGDRQ